ncbi:hypothetical protein DINM_000164 [Dirofilaria immitis]|nr:hypothetical protein [Dirofilaria immitis]
MILLSVGQNPLILSVTCRNYGKVLLRGQLDDCVPENFRCFLKNPVIVNSTELVCIMDNENAASKAPLVSCIVTGNVLLMNEKCSEEGDCHSVTVSCPIVKLDNDIISDNDVVEQEQNIIPEKTLHHPPPPLPTIQEGSEPSCYFFNNSKTSGIDGSNRDNWKSCSAIDAVCSIIGIATVSESSIICAIHRNEQLHDCRIIWKMDKQRCHDSNCLSIRLNCPVLEEYEMILPTQKSKTGVLGLVLSLAFFTGVIAACIGSYFQQDKVGANCNLFILLTIFIVPTTDLKPLPKMQDICIGGE